MSIRARILLTLLGVILLAACSASPKAPVDPTQALATRENPGTMLTTDPMLKKFTDLAITDLASRFKLEAASIETVLAESITWPNSALGCPKPGKVYAQGRVPGFRIKLNSAGKEYVYHTDREGTMVLCQPAAEGEMDGPSAPFNPNDTPGGQMR
jgi:hypothetical protein